MVCITYLIIPPYYTEYPKTMNIHLYPLLILPLLPLQALAQTPSPTPADSTGPKTYQVGAITVSARKKTTVKLQGAQGGDLLLKDELFKAACCNLGESFSTNPSVDVSYDDAATGAKQEGQACSNM